jgi:hypothetical protein
MLYEIRDPLLGAGVLQLAAVALSQTEGLVVRVQAAGIPSGIELIAAFGGVNGRRGSRDGDIGTERVPIGEYFQLQPEFCRDNRIEIAGSGFTLQSRAGTLAGLFPVSARLALGDAKQWDRFGACFHTRRPDAAEIERGQFFGRATTYRRRGNGRRP